MNKAKAIGRLDKALDQIPVLRKQQLESMAFTEWQRNTKVAIEHIFGKESEQVTEFTGIHYFLGYTTSYSDTDCQRDFLNGLDDAEALLTSMKKEVEEYSPSLSEQLGSKILHHARALKAFWLNRWTVLLTALITLFVGMPNVIKFFKESQPISSVNGDNTTIFVDNRIGQNIVNFNGAFDSMPIPTNQVSQILESFRHSVGEFSDTVSNQFIRLEKAIITKIPQGISPSDSIFDIHSNTVLHAPASILALQKQMKETYNIGNTSNAVFFAQQGISLWENVSAIYSHEAILVDRRFLDSISSMFIVKGESCLFQSNFNEAFLFFEKASKLDVGNSITNDAFMVAAAQLASRDSIVEKIISSYYNKSDPERFAFGNLLAQMGYLLPYKIGQDDKGRHFYTSIDIVKTLRLPKAVQYPFFFRLKKDESADVIVIPRWIGLNKYEPLHLDGAAYIKQRKEFELSHLLNDQTNSVNTDTAKR